MMSKTNSTYIMLEKGIEDLALYDEIDDLFSFSKIETYKEFIKKYPTLHDLKQTLRDELETTEL